MTKVVEMPQRSAATLSWLTTSEIFAELPATPWIARGLHLGPGRPVLLAGYGASAKTLAAQALALAVASGRPIWSHFEVAGAGQVLHLDYEQGEQATRRRYQRLALGHGIDTTDIGDRLRLAPLPRVFLDSKGAAEVLERELCGAQLAIVDSLRAAAPTLDENDSAVRSALDVLTLASARTGCAVLLLHHAGKAQDRHSDARTVARGSSAIFDAAGNVLVISQGKSKTDPRKVTQTKVPAESEGAPIADFLLAVEDVEVAGNSTAGVRVTYRAAEARAPSSELTERSSANDEHVLTVLRRYPGKSQTELRALAREGRRLSNQEVGDSMHRLLERGKARTTAREGKGGGHLYWPSEGAP